MVMNSTSILFGFEQIVISALDINIFSTNEFVYI